MRYRVGSYLRCWQCPQQPLYNLAPLDKGVEVGHTGFLALAGMAATAFCTCLASTHRAGGVATGAWDKWLADHDVAVLAAWCHLLLVPTSVRKVSLVQYWARCRRWRSCYRRLMHRAHALADSHNPAPCVGPTAPAWCRTRLCRVCIRTRSQPIGTAVALLLTSSPTHEVRLRPATLPIATTPRPA